MEENYLKRSLTLAALVTGCLLLFLLIPEFTIGSWKFKKVNLLADIKPVSPKKKVAIVDTVKTNVAEPKKKKEKPHPPGLVPIEDYSEEKRSLSKFFRALRETRDSHVRVAFFGDSFIEGDILCGSFRDTLQGIFGGQGVGYVPITSEVARYRTTIQHSFSQWKTYSIVGEKSASSPVSTPGYCFVPLEGNEVEYKPAKRRNSKFNTVRLLYKTSVGAQLNYVVNDTIQLIKEIQGSDSLQQFIIPQRDIGSIKLNFTTSDSLKAYGATFESPTGIFVDNFSMRGNSGMGLYQINPKQHHEFNRFRDYKLILVQYGLNVVSETDSAGYGWYVEKMSRIIMQLKESFPGANIVILSVSDRSSNQNGTFATMPNIITMRDAQRQIAMKCHVAFWDLFSAMGGENSMLDYVKATPPLAAKDYTHLTWWGGKKIARKLADALLYEQKRYEGKK